MAKPVSVTASGSGRSVLKGAFSVLLLALCLALLAGVALRWREISWSAWIWLAAFVLMFAIRMPHTVRNRANVIVDARKDAGEKLLLTAMFVTMMGLPLLHLATGVFAFADYTLPDWAMGIGAMMQLPFLWLFWRSHADLGRNWSPGLEVREDHGLVTRGVYKRMRHPMYAAIWLSALTQPLLVQNWIAGALVIPAFAAMYFIRVPNEEALMRRRFGETYDEYCASTGRIWPRFG